MNAIAHHPGTRSSVRPGALVWALAALVVAALVYLDAYFAPVVRAAGVHAALEALAGVVALAGAYLLLERLRATRAVRELAAVVALACLGATSLVDGVAQAGAGGFARWGTIVGGLFGAVALGVAALAPAIRLRRDERVTAAAAVALPTSIVVVTVLAAVLVQVSPDVIARGGYTSTVAPAMLATALGTFMLAALAFAARARSSGDPLLAWFCASSILAALASVGALVAPAPSGDALVPADFLWLASYTVLLVGAARGIRGHWRTVAHVAALEERQRMAREFHDGLAQDLALIVSQTRRSASVGGRLDDVAAAAERALAEVRKHIAGLTAPIGSLELELRDLAVQAAARGTAVTIEIERGLELTKTTARELAAIAREAVADAVDHGAATRVAVDLRRDDGLRLRAVDNGRGRDTSTPRRNGDAAALAGIGERTRALGGELLVTPGRDGGTEIEVVVP